MQRLGDARGQASSEYVALVALVAVVLALAAGLTSGGVGGQVLAGLQRGLCRVAGTSCPRVEAPRPDLAPCTLERTTSGQSLGGAFELVKLDSGGTLTAERRSDGRVAVTLADATDVGVEVGVGLKLSIGGRRRAAEATAGLTASVESGRSWTLPDVDAARAFVDRYGAKATVGGKAVDLVRSRCSLLCDAIGWRPHAELPPPDETWVGAGAATRLAASLGPATFEASGAGLLGARVRRDGTSSWFLEVTSAVGAELASPTRALGAGGERQAVVSYTLDAEQRPLELTIHSAVRGSAHGGLQGRRGGWSGAVRGDGALLTELDETLDLRDPRNRAAATAFVAALRDPRQLGELTARTAAVRERIASSGVVDRRTYAVTSSAFELGAKVALGAQLGATFERTREGVRLLTAETRLPGLPFLPRDDCRAT